VAFDRETRVSVDSYARDDLDGDLNNHVEFFSFLADDPGLMQRVGEEYFSARYLYKLWEGLRVGEDWARRAQVQLQVQQYASIYEACLHHLLFGQCVARPEVQALLKLRTLKEWNVAAPLRAKLAEAPAPDSRAVVAAIESWITHDETKVRFEHKADAAVSLGIIDGGLAAELKDFYAARNMIHIHAEIRRGADWSWELQFARDAYRRLHVFKKQVLDWQLLAAESAC
jgi:hypothetical protein